MSKRRIISVISVMLSIFLLCNSSTAFAFSKTENYTVYNSGSDASSDLPEAYVTELITSVKNQGSQGLCWSFAAMGCLEAYLLNEGIGEYDFSEEHPNWWALDDSNGYGWSGRILGDGGWSEIPMGYLISWNGPVRESDVPYQDGANVFPDKFYSASKEIGVTGIKLIDDDINEIKQAVMDHYAVSTSYNSRTYYYNDIRTAYYSPTVANPNEGHAICVVGWDDNYSKDNFGNSLSNKQFQPENDGAWLCKNSWGTDSGYNEGYLWISYEDAYIFNQEYGTAYAITDAQRINSDTHMYQVESYGATYKYPVKEDHGFELHEATFANIYDFDNSFDTIDKVIFFSDSVGADYTIYYIPLVLNGIMDSDRDNWIALSSGKVDYIGYTCDDIADYKIDATKGAIGIYMSNPNGSVTIGVDEWMSQAETNKMYFLPDAKKGISYIIDNNGARDILDMYAENGDTIGGQISIKLVATRSDDTNTIDSDTLTDTDTSFTDTENTSDSDIYTDDENFLIGDVDSNGSVKMYDAVLIQRNIAKLITFNTTQRKRADVNRDNIINLTDVVMIQKYIANLIKI